MLVSLFFFSSVCASIRLHACYVPQQFTWFAGLGQYFEISSTKTMSIECQAKKAKQCKRTDNIILTERSCFVQLLTPHVATDPVARESTDQPLPVASDASRVPMAPLPIEPLIKVSSIMYVIILYYTFYVFLRFLLKKLKIKLIV